MIRFLTDEQPAATEEVEAALQRLDAECGAYFGVDAGIAGLHPLQATLIERPALALRLHGDGLQVEPLSPFGEAMLRLPALAAWHARALRGAGQGPIPALRALMACFAPSPDVLLLGALPFEAHRLAGAIPGAGPGSFGTFFFGESCLRRDAAGRWKRVTLSLADSGTAPPAAPARRGAAPPPAAPAPAPAPGDDYPPGGYAGMVRCALDHLARKPLVSLTLSQSYRRAVDMPASAAFARLRQANPAPASFFVNDGAGLRLFGASPDLQLVVNGRVVQALPVCGTVARRPGAVGEAASLRELINEEVDAASLAVCSDALRNDLAPLCEPGSLRLVNRRHTMSLATVVHAVDRLEGRLKPGADAWDAILATAAPVMVTGTPRAHALASIAELEASPRGWYGGLIVQVAADGTALAGTILRAAAVRGGVAEVRTGGDLMADSSPEREEQESRLKTLSLWRAFGLEATAGAPVAGAGTTAPPDGVPPAVGLVDRGDPFGAAVREALLGLGLRIEEGAPVGVCIGIHGPPPDVRNRGVVALGDAAVQWLAGAGFETCPLVPEHGRAVRSQPTDQAPAGWPRGEMQVARYATLALAPPAEWPPGWQAWAVDESGLPLALAQPQTRVACLLFRPESLLSEPAALQALRAALAFSAGAAN